MSIHANVVVKCADGLYRAIYVHSDGYGDAPHGVGHMLRTYHNSQKLAEEVVKFGAASQILQKTSPAKGTAHSFDNPQDGVSIYYSRDRDQPELSYAGEGSSPEEAIDDSDFGTFTDTYLWNGTDWVRF